MSTKSHYIDESRTLDELFADVESHLATSVPREKTLLADILAKRGDLEFIDSVIRHHVQTLREEKIVPDVLLLKFCVDRLEEKLWIVEKLSLKAVKASGNIVLQKSRIKSASIEMEEALEFTKVLGKSGTLATYLKSTSLTEILGNLKSHLSNIGDISWKRRTTFDGVGHVAQWMTDLCDNTVESVADTPRTSNSLKISEDEKVIATQEHASEMDVSKTDGETVENASEDTNDVSEENKGTASDEGDADKEMKESNGSQENKEIVSDESDGHKEVKESTESEKASENADQGVVIREDLKAVFQKFGTVKYIDFKMGEESGYIRFEEPEASQKACAAAVLNEEGGLLVKNYVATLEPVSGDAEKEFWSEIQGNQKPNNGS